MSKIYFGFAIGDSMFPQNGTIIKKSLEVLEAKKIIKTGVIPCLNPSHLPTISAMRERFKINVEIPESPPKISLEVGDKIIVMGVQGLPRLTDRHEYNHDEIEKATFSFSLYQSLPEFIFYNFEACGCVHGGGKYYEYEQNNYFATKENEQSHKLSLPDGLKGILIKEKK